MAFFLSAVFYSNRGCSEAVGSALCSDIFPNHSLRHGTVFSESWKLTFQCGVYLNFSSVLRHNISLIILLNKSHRPAAEVKSPFIF
jgi:hypothetical protein